MSDELRPARPTAYAIGKFDALHLGHRALVLRAAALGAPALLTFSGMAEVLGWPQRLPLIAPSQRDEVVDAWAIELGQPILRRSVPFSTVRDLDPAGFVRYMCKELNAGALVVGEDFRFGRERSGDVAQLVRLAEQAHCALGLVPPVLHEGRAISSSDVRKALQAGAVELVHAYLGRPHCLVGTVVRGDGRGRQLGFPTANCAERENLEPGGGVYAAWAHVGAGAVRYPAAVNVGRLPTIAENRPLSVEAHLIGYEGDCYGSRLALSFIGRLRDERRFAGLDELKQQLARDIAAARAVLTASSAQRTP